ncbi:hypothetical protein ASPZODRAFT_19755 [Penicilliopsis zonata CBS 506.65]|uniref:MYND-type domain-containing protein n=1 Tax=Penicilliopsis zonata CBS 506.65 TaxID=1073090 RepID=A0A1L9S7C4_9EURO|nr:hypothetical protein ASPZODRAFT_19755 [Penicilliopsis zonata CBS 506.65]OJJ43054.1 hypothetical protein ASPZODRAFT_19755 [Penicilliopsis zonata CBS 506.65]
MMFYPAVLSRLSFFYPVGNTPAVNLTQHIPSTKKADLLLLGCGDVRNVLFTAYMNASRSLDITCCDIEPATLARNILLLSLLVEDETQTDPDTLWSVYYHIFLEEKSLEALDKQACRLYAASASWEKWQESKYAALFKFCDRSSLSMIRNVWGSYRVLQMTEQERQERNQRFLAELRLARERKKLFVGKEGQVITGPRSLAPAAMLELLDIAKLYKFYWEKGTTNATEDHRQYSQAALPNPLFTSPSGKLADLHYGTDPLLGFHLALGYCPITKGSPFSTSSSSSSSSSKDSNLHKAVRAARLEFSEWCLSFKNASKTCILRFFVGDALAFCHALQSRSSDGQSLNTGIFRGQYISEAISMNEEDYCDTGPGPRCFDVIDTSNLADHFGVINFLTAAAPLLHGPNSALYTEFLLRQAKPTKALSESLLCGPLSTMTLLLGLYPVEFWSNATAIPSSEESLLSMSFQQAGPAGSQRQEHHRVMWRNSMFSLSSAPLHWNEEELARTLHHVYLKMFEFEDLAHVLTKSDRPAAYTSKRTLYHRGSFALLLRHIKLNQMTDWDKVKGILLKSLIDSSNTRTALEHQFDLFTQLHLSYSRSLIPCESRVVMKTALDFRSWDPIPALVAVTLEVPRSALRAILNIQAETLGLPVLQCKLKETRESPVDGIVHLFGSVQLAIGHVSTSGERNEPEFHLNIANDDKRFAGKCPLFASFYAPASLIYDGFESMQVALVVQETSEIGPILRVTLGPTLEIFSTDLQSKSSVYISKYLPNTSGYPSILQEASNSGQEENEGFGRQFTIKLQPDSDRVQTVTGKVSFISEKPRSILKAGCAVETVFQVPNIVDVKLKGSDSYRLAYPVPIDGNKTKARVARTSAWIEIIAPLVEPGRYQAGLMYPFTTYGDDLTYLNMPRVDLDQLPEIDVRKPSEIQWLNVHVGGMFTSKERPMKNGLIPTDTLCDLKDSLFTLFAGFAGVQGQKSNLFAINNPQDGGIHLIILPRALLFDTSNRSVVIDAAVLPLTLVLIPEIKEFLACLMERGMLCSKATADELKLWKTLLPAWVERCRTWEHRSTCEYRRGGKVPVSLESAQPVLCSCGSHSLPLDYGLDDIPGMNKARKYLVRAAISPVFSSRFSDSDADFLSPPRQRVLPADQCGLCKKTKSETGKNLLRCSRCQKKYYCSAQCQKADWMFHKQACVAAKSST